MTSLKLAMIFITPLTTNNILFDEVLHKRAFY